MLHLYLAGDFQSQVESLFGGGAADGRFAFGEDAFDEVPEFKLKRFFLIDGNGFAHNFFCRRIR